jgi:hypothetical protein
MTKIELNVGLKIGTLGILDFNKTKARILELYSSLQADDSEIYFQYQEGKYLSDGITQTEPTMVVELFVAYREDIAEALLNTTKILCKETFQECIALFITFLHSDPKGVLVYNENYRGTFQDFDMQYFLPYKSHVIQYNY